jgi:hypothetical protein
MEYVGKTHLSEADIDEIIKRGECLELNECRCMRVILMPMGGQISQDIIMTPVSIARGPVRLKIKPSTYWWPDQDEAGMRAILRNIEACKASELVTRAKDAGIEPVGRG